MCKDLVMKNDFIKFNELEIKTNIKQYWMNIDDLHLDIIANRDDLADAIEDSYHIEKRIIDQQIDEWINKQVNIDGHLYQVDT